MTETLARREDEPLPRLSDEAIRFWAKTDTPEIHGCAIWMGYKNERGYGYFGFRRKVMRAHRVAWIMRHGNIPDGMHVLHSCDNPSCVNPDHLHLGTHSQNIREGVERGRIIPPKTAKLTEEDVIAIRRDARPVKTLVAQYGVTKENINCILRRATWTDIG